jgi:(1->4)-alpha-D-glucan 1-alpha-D-glucosylmutase
MLGADPSAREAALTDWLASWTDGRIKLAITAAGLRLRREHPALFQRGRYVPLVTEMTVQGSVAAFARVGDTTSVVFAAPRLCAGLETDGTLAPIGMECWKTSRVLLPDELAGRTFRHALTGAEVRPMVGGAEVWLPVGQIFQTIPVGVLVGV